MVNKYDSKEARLLGNTTNKYDYLGEVAGMVIPKRDKRSWRKTDNDFLPYDIIRAPLHENLCIVTVNHIIENLDDERRAILDAAQPGGITFLPAGSFFRVSFQHGGERLLFGEFTRSETEPAYNNNGIGAYVPTTNGYTTVTSTNPAIDPVQASSDDPEVVAGTATVDNVEPLKTDGTNIYTLGSTAEFPAFDIYMVNPRFRPKSTNYATAPSIVADPVLQRFPEGYKIADSTETGGGFVGKVGSPRATLYGKPKNTDLDIVIRIAADAPVDSFLIIPMISTGRFTGS